MSSDILLYITLKTILFISNGLNYLAVDILAEFQTVSVCIYASYIGYFDKDNNDTCYYRIDGMWLVVETRTSFVLYDDSTASHIPLPQHELILTITDTITISTPVLFILFILSSREDLIWKLELTHSCDRFYVNYVWITLRSKLFWTCITGVNNECQAWNDISVFRTS